MEIINVHTPRGLVLKGAMWGDNTMNTVVIMMSGICSNVFQNELLPATGNRINGSFVIGSRDSMTNHDAEGFIRKINSYTKNPDTNRKT